MVHVLEGDVPDERVAEGAKRVEQSDGYIGKQAAALNEVGLMCQRDGERDVEPAVRCQSVFREAFGSK
ncbi:hypothetical protein ACGFII_31675 [Micromonospora chalcea]